MNIYHLVIITFIMKDHLQWEHIVSNKWIYSLYSIDPRGEIRVSSSDIGTDIIACITFRLI